MTEPRVKPVEGYLMRDTRDNTLHELDPSTAQRGMNAFEPGSSIPNFVPVGDIPGFVFKDDGGTIATMFNPKGALAVAQTQAGPKTPHRLAFGKDDPGFRAAKVYREDQVLRQIGKNKGFGEVFGEHLFGH